MSDNLGQGQPGEPSPDPAGDVEEWLEYDLHEWALEKRVMLQQLLNGEQVVHTWQGTTLHVHHSLEEAVDELIEEVEEVAEGRVDLGSEVVAFEMGDLPGELHDDLLENLGAAGVPYEIDEDGDLVVRVEDEERTESVIHELLARAGEADLVEMDGLELNDLLSALFVACDRLRRNPRDADGVLEGLDSARQVAQVRTPFGFSAVDWRAARAAAGRLVEMLEGDETHDEDLRELAQGLRDVLHRLI